MPNFHYDNLSREEQEKELKELKDSGEFGNLCAMQIIFLLLHWVFIKEGF